MHAHVHPHAHGMWLAGRHPAEVRPRVFLEAEARARAHGDEALPRGPLSSRLAPQVSSEAMGVEISSLTMQQYMQGKKLKKNAAEREGMEAALRKKDREAAEAAAEIRDLHATVARLREEAVERERGLAEQARSPAISRPLPRSPAFSCLLLPSLTFPRARPRRAGEADARHARRDATARVDAQAARAARR